MENMTIILGVMMFTVVVIGLVASFLPPVRARLNRGCHDHDQ